MQKRTTQEAVMELVAARRGHFLLESGHHGDLWLDLEVLCLHPQSIEPFAIELATRLAASDIEFICGPLVEGAFIGLMVASKMNKAFAYTERFARASTDELFPAGYRVPDRLRQELKGKRGAIVNDVINAGSAMRGTFDDLEACGAIVVAIGALLILGTAAFEFASMKAVPLEAVATLPNSLWAPENCPLCSSGVPLQDIAGFRSVLPGGPHANSL
jgi:orotate phosphoribosyltransferase